MHLLLSSPIMSPGRGLFGTALIYPLVKLLFADDDPWAMEDYLMNRDESCSHIHPSYSSQSGVSSAFSMTFLFG
jgi:hypothetical protein